MLHHLRRTLFFALAILVLLALVVPPADACSPPNKVMQETVAN